MQITSSAFAHGQYIPKKYAREGENISPPLEIQDIPHNAVCFVLIMHDPDVPVDLRPDGNFDHWVLFNVPITNGITEGNAQGVLGTNTRGELSYTGPNPPYGEHRYFFKLYALDMILDLPRGSNRQQVESAIQGHIITQAELIGKYKRE